MGSQGRQSTSVRCRVRGGMELQGVGAVAEVRDVQGRRLARRRGTGVHLPALTVCRLGRRPPGAEALDWRKDAEVERAAHDISPLDAWGPAEASRRA